MFSWLVVVVGCVCVCVLACLRRRAHRRQHCCQPLKTHSQTNPHSHPPQKNNNEAIQIIFYAIVGHNQIALAFLLSTLFSSAKTATVFAYLLVFGTGLIGYLLLGQLIKTGLW